MSVSAFTLIPRTRERSASAFGAYRDCIRDRSDGFLCDTEADWTKTLLECVANPDRLEALGGQAREQAVASYPARPTRPRTRVWDPHSPPALGSATREPLCRRTAAPPRLRSGLFQPL